jgi:predicted acylesterase/phospholipase RssA
MIDVSPASPGGSSKRTVALFNYGGGMRGLIPAHFMARLEQVTGLHMTDMVDIFSGPSTAAILNAALNMPSPEDPSRPKYRAAQMVRFYEREGLKIFPPDRFREFRAFVHDFNNRTMKISTLKGLFRQGHYHPGHLQKSLRAMYGDNKLSATLRSLIVPVYNLDGDALQVVEEDGDSDNAPVHTQNNFVDQGGYAVWLKNIKTGRSLYPTPDVSVYDAVLASCAAPTFFPCHNFKAIYGRNNKKHIEYAGIDGSIFDNPCISYHGAIRQHVPEGSKLTMIIFGTGHTLRSFKKDDWNSFGGLGVVDPVNDLPLINILFHASETALIESFAQETKDNVFTFNKSLIAGGGNPRYPSQQIDDASPENLKRLQYFFEETLEENKAKFDEVCHILVGNRDTKQEEKSTLLKDMKRFFKLPGFSDDKNKK